jgi:hypothetical protein
MDLITVGFGAKLIVATECLSGKTTQRRHSLSSTRRRHVSGCPLGEAVLADQGWRRNPSLPAGAVQFFSP